jgi:hypothetical protein
VTQTQLDETTDYARLLGVFAAFGPQVVDTTPSIATPWDQPEPRITLAKRVSFIFTRDGRIAAYMALRGESVNVLAAGLPADPSRAGGASGYHTLRDVLAIFSEQDVRNDPNAADGPRIILSSRSTFCFSPDGSIRLYSDLANDKNAYVKPSAAAPRAAQAAPQTAPAPAEKTAPERLRVPFPGQGQQREKVQQQIPLAKPEAGQQQSTAAAPRQEGRKTGGS